MLEQREKQFHASAGRKIILALTGLILAGVTAGYILFCTAIAGNKLLLGTSMMGVDLGGLDYTASVQKWERELPDKINKQNIELFEPLSNTKTLLEAQDFLDTSYLLDDLWEDQKPGNVFARGVQYLSKMFWKDNPVDHPVTWTISKEGEDQLNQVLAEMSQKVQAVGQDSSWLLAEEELTFYMGITGRELDIAKTKEDVETAFLEGKGGIVEASVIHTPPSSLDLNAVRESIYTSPVNVRLDKQSMEIIPDVDGMDFDPSAVQAVLDMLGEGEEYRAPVIRNEASITADGLQEVLFRDTLSSAETKFTGTADRLKSIKNAAGFINDMILLPGEEFPYNSVCEPYTEANGYGKAGAYVNGATVDTVAGGICQLSSTLYWATLRANLEVTERHNHAYYPTYISGGLDATKMSMSKSMEPIPPTSTENHIQPTKSLPNMLKRYMRQILLSPEAL